MLRLAFSFQSPSLLIEKKGIGYAFIYMPLEHLVKIVPKSDCRDLAH